MICSCHLLMSHFPNQPGSNSFGATASPGAQKQGFSAQLTTFGLPTLDEALGGGIPRGSVVLVEDEIGSEADPFLMQFLTEGLRSGDYTYILSTEHSFDYFENLLSTQSVNPRILYETGRLQFIDAFTNPYGYSDVKTSFSHSIRNLSQPREINDAIRRALLSVQQQRLATRGVLDSLSSIIHAAVKPSIVFSLLHTRIAANKATGDVTLITIHRDAHDPLFVKAIEHIVDGVIKVSRGRVDDKVTQDVEIVHLQGKPELTGRVTQYEFLRGRILPLVD